MEAVEALEIISRGEDTRHQFKREISNPESLASELVAFSNTHGGQLFVGVNDDGTIAGLSSEEVQKLNQLVSNVSSQGIKPPINVETENIKLPSGLVIVITIPDGISKPYMDKDGVIWVKSGSDKRRATGREEIQRMFQRQGLIHADETEVKGLSFSDIDFDYFKTFFYKQYGTDFDSQENPLTQILENMNLSHDGTLNVAGAVLFGKNIAYKVPNFIVKAVAFNGTEENDSTYRDKRELKGKLADVFQQAFSFAMEYGKFHQGRQGFNSNAVPVVPREVMEELLANALVHRDYFVPAAVRLFVFSDRIEIISPGHLPNNLTVENIKAGNSVCRNPIISSFASTLLPYSGIGTGIRRALKMHPHIDFVDDREGNCFRAVIWY